MRLIDTGASICLILDTPAHDQTRTDSNYHKICKMSSAFASNSGKSASRMEGIIERAWEVWIVPA
jgi:hypothetical protein